MAVGLFLCLEGLDGCGKSTHAKLLAEWLRSEGREVAITEEPTDNPIGKILKRGLRGGLKLSLEAEALLFAADRVQHVMEDVQQPLDAGKVVITERYICSSLAYQSERGLPQDWIKKINERAPKPDLVIMIDVPVAVALERIMPSRDLDSFERDLELQKQVRKKYLELAEDGEMKIVDGKGKIEQTQAEIRKLVEQIIRES